MLDREVSRERKHHSASPPQLVDEWNDYIARDQGHFATYQLRSECPTRTAVCRIENTSNLKQGLLDLSVQVACLAQGLT